MPWGSQVELDEERIRFFFSYFFLLFGKRFPLSPFRARRERGFSEEELPDREKGLLFFFSMDEKLFSFRVFVACHTYPFFSFFSQPVHGSSSVVWQKGTFPFSFRHRWALPPGFALLDHFPMQCPFFLLLSGHFARPFLLHTPLTNPLHRCFPKLTPRCGWRVVSPFDFMCDDHSAFCPLRHGKDECASLMASVAPSRPAALPPFPLFFLPPFQT